MSQNPCSEPLPDSTGSEQIGSTHQQPPQMSQNSPKMAIPELNLFNLGDLNRPDRPLFNLGSMLGSGSYSGTSDSATQMDLNAIFGRSISGGGSAAEGLQMSQNVPKMSQNVPKISQNGSWGASEGGNVASEGGIFSASENSDNSAFQNTSALGPIMSQMSQNTENVPKVEEESDLFGIKGESDVGGCEIDTPKHSPTETKVSQKSFHLKMCQMETKMETSTLYQFPVEKSENPVDLEDVPIKTRSNVTSVPQIEDEGHEDEGMVEDVWQFIMEYRLISLLYSGPTSKVWMAVDRDNTVVAIKVLDKESLLNATDVVFKPDQRYEIITSMDRFKSELAFLSSIRQLYRSIKTVDQSMTLSAQKIQTHMHFTINHHIDYIEQMDTCFLVSPFGFPLMWYVDRGLYTYGPSSKDNWFKVRDNGSQKTSTNVLNNTPNSPDIDDLFNSLRPSPSNVVNLAFPPHSEEGRRSVNWGPGEVFLPIKSELKAIITQLFSILLELKSLKVTHKDLKPENLVTNRPIKTERVDLRDYLNNNPYAGPVDLDHPLEYDYEIHRPVTRNVFFGTDNGGGYQSNVTNVLFLRPACLGEEGEDGPVPHEKTSELLREDQPRPVLTSDGRNLVVRQPSAAADPAKTKAKAIRAKPKARKNVRGTASSNKKSSIDGAACASEDEDDLSCEEDGNLTAPSDDEDSLTGLDTSVRRRIREAFDLDVSYDVISAETDRKNHVREIQQLKLWDQELVSRRELQRKGNQSAKEKREQELKLLKSKTLAEDPTIYESLRMFRRVDPVDLNKVLPVEILDRPLLLRVIDFGHAVQSDVIYDAMGTISFTPPECYDSLETSINGSQRDLFSVGVILIILTAGYLPFYSDVPLHNELLILGGVPNRDVMRIVESRMGTAFCEWVSKLIRRESRPTVDEALGEFNDLVVPITF